MNVEAKIIWIPEYLRPLYDARTAGESIDEAVKLLKNARGQKQKEIFEEPAFGAIVRNALKGSDQYRQERERRLLESVDEETREALFEAIYPLSNS